MYSYKTRGTCSQEIYFDVDDEKRIHNVRFVGGCGGNLTAISFLVEGMKVDELSEKLGGIKCGGRGTSCADQLVKGVHAALGSNV